MADSQGKVLNLRDFTPSGMQVVLDNGVSIWISFNKNSIHMSFSGINYGKSLRIGEIGPQVRDIPLPNYLTVLYEPKEGE